MSAPKLTDNQKQAARLAIMQRLAAAEVIQPASKAMYNCLTQTLKSVKSTLKRGSTDFTVLVRSGVLMSDWRDLVIGSFVLLFDSELPNGTSMTNNALNEVSLCAFVVMGYEVDGVGSWNVRLRKLAPLIEPTEGAVVLFETGGVYSFAKCKGPCVVPTLWMDRNVREILRNPPQAPAAAVIQVIPAALGQPGLPGGAGGGDNAAETGAKGAKGGSKASKNKKRSAESLEEDEELNQLWARQREEEAANTPPPAYAGNPNLFGSTTNVDPVIAPQSYNKNLGVSVNGKSYPVSCGRGQLAADELAFCLRLWPAHLIKAVLPGLKWSFTDFLKHIHSAQAGSGGGIEHVVAAQVVHDTDPALARFSELTHPLMRYGKLVEDFIVGNIDVLCPEGETLSLSLKDFFETEFDRTKACVWGEYPTRPGRTVMARCVRMIGKMMQVFWICGLEEPMNRLVDELTSCDSVFITISDYVVSKEVWLVVVRFVAIAKKTKAVKGADGTINTLDTAQSFVALLNQQIDVLIESARTSTKFWDYMIYRGINDPQEALLKQAHASPKGTKGLDLSDAGDSTQLTTAEKAAEKKRKADAKKKAKKTKVTPSGTGPATPVKITTAAQTCHYDMGKLLGLKSADGSDYSCNLPTGTCKLDHPKRLKDVGIAEVDKMLASKYTPRVVKNALTAHRLTL